MPEHDATAVTPFPAAMVLALLPRRARATLNRAVNDRRPRPESTKMKQSQ